MLKNGLRWVALSALAIVVLAAVAWLASRYWPLPTAQRQALELVQAPLPAASGANAFAGLWLLPYDDATDAQREAVLRQDIGNARPVGTQGASAVYGSVADGVYPQVKMATSPCNASGVGCLQRVREQAAQVAQAHAGHAQLHARIDALAAASHYRSIFPSDSPLTFPPFQGVFERLPAHALAHVNGDSPLALQGLCTDARIGRMLLAQSDLLIAAMVGNALIERSAQLFAEILAELPASQPLPAACRAAFAPPQVDELRLCSAMRGELDLFRQGLVSSRSDGSWVLLDERRTLARVAPLYAQGCTAARAQQLAQDLPIAAVQPEGHWQCVANPVGCAVSDIAHPAFPDYFRRAQDAGATLRMSAALLWLRDQPAGPGIDTAALLEQLPPALRSAQRPIRVGPDGRSLQVRRYAIPNNGRGATIQLALPAQRTDR